ncbi:hypothetical protein C8Q74DRAFT_867205 [Fomes fomentarius]|nr:hypothetical protein C8Q74DRAFT_867205 [Fomes fomentarius]
MIAILGSEQTNSLPLRDQLSRLQCQPEPARYIYTKGKTTDTAIASKGHCSATNILLRSRPSGFKLHVRISLLSRAYAGLTYLYQPPFCWSTILTPPEYMACQGSGYPVALSCGLRLPHATPCTICMTNGHSRVRVRRTYRRDRYRPGEGITRFDASPSHDERYQVSPLSLGRFPTPTFVSRHPCGGDDARTDNRHIVALYLIMNQCAIV